MTDCEYFDINRDSSYMTCKISDIQGCNTYVASICCRFLEHSEPLRIDLHCRHGLSVLALPRVPMPKLSAPIIASDDQPRLLLGKTAESPALLAGDDQELVIMNRGYGNAYQT